MSGVTGQGVHVSKGTVTSRGLSTGRRHRGSLVQALGRAILAGRFAPGDLIDGEVAGAYAYGVSRCAYREAVRMLVAKGLVTSRPRHGTKVLPRRCWNMIDVDVLDWGLAGGSDAGLARSIVELSAIIEPAAAAMAARRRSRDDMDGLQGALREIRRCRPRTDQHGSAIRAIHKLVLSAAHSPALVAMGAAVAAAADQRLLLAGDGREFLRDDLPAYAALVNSIRSSDERRAEVEMQRLVAQAPHAQHGGHVAVNAERASAKGEVS